MRKGKNMFLTALAISYIFLLAHAPILERPLRLRPDVSV